MQRHRMNRCSLAALGVCAAMLATFATPALAAGQARDADATLRGDATGGTTNPETLKAQLQFIPGATSEPAGPGKNAAGLAIFRYRTTCGTMYGHTGNTLGFTQFIAATSDGTRSVSVSVNAQITPKSDAERFTQLRRIFGLAACAALKGS
jgi:D-alanyl-D-alanine carboxypeptidase